MSRIKAPSKEKVRAWLLSRRHGAVDFPGIEQIQRELDWVRDHDSSPSPAGAPPTFAARRKAAWPPYHVYGNDKIA